ncbi:hypothetical protein FVQ98_07270 [Ottowia sp. GY511]|uniref:Uncharacterized protein n=1 Tax=Ottowia flava TaxID=2675430 RepID=A0ABW4KPG5_9BURK|nr:hypothetical protein [Ottowia sp. GY511]TXK29687.1 hypothetical protein FVQ98_07270 [Ottowia sp. GY511]
MSNLRLGAYKLPAAEVVLVQTLFRLYAHGGDFNWTFVSAPPYDALLVDGTSGDVSVEAAHMAKSVLRLTRMNDEGGPDTLSRPIRADKLQAWLNSIEYGFQDTRPVTQLAGALSEPALTTATEPPEIPVSPLRFKLRRWPPAALLRSDPNRIRMATILSRRALNAAELSTISGQAVNECQAFLQTLQTTGLVEVQQEPIAPPPSVQAQAPSRSALTAATAKPTFARGLISGIRRRLGL